MSNRVHPQKEQPAPQQSPQEQPAPQQSPGPQAPPAMKVSDVAETRRTDNFMRAIDGIDTPWIMDAATLKVHLASSGLAPAILEALDGTAGVDLLDKCLEETEKPPWVKLRRNHHGDRLGKCKGVKLGQLGKLDNHLKRCGLGFAALLYRSCHQQTQLMDYRWVRLLGEGGFGQVHEVIHRHHAAGSPHMALKLIKAVHGSHDDEEAVTRKLKQTAKEMEHHQRAASTSEFVVSLFTWGQIGEEFFFVSMELCTGGDVAQLLEADEQLGHGLEMNLRWKLFEQIALGIEAIHAAVRCAAVRAHVPHAVDNPPSSLISPDDPRYSDLFLHLTAACPSPFSFATYVSRRQNLIHLDMKPNVLLTGDAFDVRIADLGLATLTTGDGTTQQTHGGGTMGYLAPEVVSKKFSAKADSYSIAVTYFDMAAGRQAAGKPTLPQMDTDDPCAPLREDESEESQMTYELLVFALHLKSADRPSAGELAAKIRALRASGSSTTFVSTEPDAVVDGEMVAAPESKRSARPRITLPRCTARRTILGSVCCSGTMLCVFVSLFATAADRYDTDSEISWSFDTMRGGAPFRRTLFSTVNGYVEELESHSIEACLFPSPAPAYVGSSTDTSSTGDACFEFVMHLTPDWLFDDDDYGWDEGVLLRHDGMLRSYHLYTASSYINLYPGQTYIIRDVPNGTVSNTNTIVASGALMEGQWGADVICLDGGCYTLEVTSDVNYVDWEWQVLNWVTLVVLVLMLLCIVIACCGCFFHRDLDYAGITGTAPSEEVPSTEMQVNYPVRTNTSFISASGERPNSYTSAQQSMIVTIPPGTVPGMTIEVQTPNGHVLMVPVSHGLTPGMEIQVNYSGAHLDSISTPTSGMVAEHSPTAPIQQSMLVTIPPGTVPGMSIQAQTPTGQVMMVTVPYGMSPGMAMQVNY